MQYRSINIERKEDEKYAERGYHLLMKVESGKCRRLTALAAIDVMSQER